MEIAQGIAEAAPGPGARRRPWWDRAGIFKWIPFVPVQALILFLTIPFLLLLYLSVRAWRVTRGPWWLSPPAGLANYAEALANDRFLWAVGRTFLFAGTAVAIEFLLGLLLALLAYREFPGRRFYTTVFLVPMMIVPVVVGYDFSMLLVDTGPVNQVLSLLTGRDINVAWLSGYTAAKVAVVAADVWQWTPLMFLIFVSGLATMPQDPIRAARVLGARPWQVLWYVQLPLLKPLIAIALVLRAMEAVKMFDYPVLLTGGGPGNATETLALYLWRMGWEYSRVSEAAAMSILVLVVTAVYVLLGLRLLKREREALG